MKSTTTLALDALDIQIDDIKAFRESYGHCTPFVDVDTFLGAALARLELVRQCCKNLQLEELRR